MSDVPAFYLPLCTLAGSAIAFYGILKQQRNAQRHEAAAITGAIVTEIETTVSVIILRRYVQDIERIESDLLKNPEKTANLTVQVTDIHFPVYHACLSKIGLIHPDVRLHAVKFYQLMEAVILDVRPGGLASEGAGYQVFNQLMVLAQRAMWEAECVEKMSEVLSARDASLWRRILNFVW